MTSVDTTARNQFAALEKFEVEIACVSRLATASSSSASASTSASSRQYSSSGPSSDSDHICVSGGLPRDTPEEEAIQAVRDFLKHIRVREPPKLESPYLLGSVVHAKFQTMQELRAHVDQIRLLDQTARTFRGHVMWATVPQTKERRARNRRLLRATEVLQKYSVVQTLKSKPAYKLVCWRNATVVMGHKRVCTISDGGSMVAWLPEWYSADLYTEKQDIIEAESNSIE